VPWLVIDTPDMAEVMLLGESMLSSGAASVFPVLTWASLGMALTAHTVLSSCHSHATRRVERLDLQHLCLCQPGHGIHCTQWSSQFVVYPKEIGSVVLSS